MTSHEDLEQAGTLAAWRFVAWCLLVSIVVMTIWPFDLSPVGHFSTDSGLVYAYGILAASFMVGYPTHIRFALMWPITCAITQVALPVIMGAERFHIPGAFWKAVGIAIGIGTAYAWNLSVRVSAIEQR